MSNMLAPQRHAIILRELDAKTTVSTRRLTQTLGVSRETVRKDIEFLAQTAKLEQVRGGATKIRTSEVPMINRTQLNSEGKDRIAKTLARLIPNGSSLFLDNGSSTQVLAAALKEHQALQVYTNDMRVAHIFAPTSAEVVLIGGRVDSDELATFGIEALEQAAQYHVDVSVISAGGLSAQALLTDFSKPGVALRSQILRAGRKKYVIADKEKFGVVGQFAMPAMSAGTTIIMDCDPDRDVIEALESEELTWVIANSA